MARRSAFFALWVAARALAGAATVWVLLALSWVAAGAGGTLGPGPATAAVGSVGAAALALGDWLVLRRRCAVHWGYVPALIPVSGAGTLAVGMLPGLYAAAPAARAVYALGGTTAYNIAYLAVVGAVMGVLFGGWQWAFLRRTGQLRRPWLLFPLSVVWLGALYAMPMPWWSTAPPADGGAALPALPLDLDDLKQIASGMAFLSAGWAAMGLATGAYLAAALPPKRPT